MKQITIWVNKFNYLTAIKFISMRDYNICIRKKTKKVLEEKTVKEIKR